MLGGRAARAARLCLLALTLIGTPANAAAPVALHVKLAPERLGAPTTITFGFDVSSAPHTVPPPLTRGNLLYPAHINLAGSELGLKHCTTQALERQGPPGCPGDSLMGYGTALVEIPIGSEIIEETAEITIWMGPLQNGHLQLLFDAEGYVPVAAQVIIPSLVQEAPPPYGGQLTTNIPIIENIPEAPNPALVRLHVTLGPKNLTYHLHYHGKTLTYHPTGLLLPEHCPHTGFQFAAHFTFLDGSHTTTHATVPCPKARQHR